MALTGSRSARRSPSRIVEKARLEFWVYTCSDEMEKKVEATVGFQGLGCLAGKERLDPSSSATVVLT